MAEIAALKKEVAKLKAERDMPQEKRQLSSPGSRHDVRFRCEAPAYLAISWMCAVLGVSRSGFHAWLRRPTSERAIHDAKLVAAIDKSFKASDRTYGARRVWRDVLEDGLACGLHRIERLMRQNAMKARPKRRGKPKDDGERSVIADSEPVNATDGVDGPVCETGGRAPPGQDKRWLS